MQTSRLIQVVHAHAEGEVGDVIVGGVPPPPGDTLWQQSRWIAADGGLRAFVLNEPRGGVFRHVNLLVPPKTAGADAAWIIMEPEDTPPMSGSNSMCVATVLLETGIIAMREPETLLRLEAPGGIVEVRAACRNGMVEHVTVRNVASFVDRFDQPLEIDGLGTIRVDTAYGGDSFVIVDAASLGFAVRADEARDLATLGARITDAANRQIGFAHPANADWRHLSFCQFAAPLELRDGIKTGRSAVAIKPAKLDRSPTGTGCSARLALLHAKGEIAVGEPFVGISPVGSEFFCRIEATAAVGDRPAIIPSIRGRAWITGTSQLMLDPRDPWPSGYRLSDTWPTP